MTISPTLLIALEDTKDAERRVRDLRALGIECEPATNLDAALASLATGPFPAIVVEWDAGGGSALLRAVVAQYPDVRVIALAKEDMSVAVDAMRAGAWDVVPTTAEPSALAEAWRRLLERSEEAPARTAISRTW